MAMQSQKIRDVAEYFIPGKGIRKEVLDYRLEDFFGRGASVRPAKLSEEIGWLVEGGSRVTPAIIEDLQKDTAKALRVARDAKSDKQYTSQGRSMDKREDRPSNNRHGSTKDARGRDDDDDDDGQYGHKNPLSRKRDAGYEGSATSLPTPVQLGRDDDDNDDQYGNRRKGKSRHDVGNPKSPDRDETKPVVSQPFPPRKDSFHPPPAVEDPLPPHEERYPSQSAASIPQRGSRPLDATGRVPSSPVAAKTLVAANTAIRRTHSGSKSYYHPTAAAKRKDKVFSRKDFETDNDYEEYKTQKRRNDRHGR